MEAIELYKKECLKLLEYEEECKAVGKKVKLLSLQCNTTCVYYLNTVTSSPEESHHGRLWCVICKL